MENQNTIEAFEKITEGLNYVINLWQKLKEQSDNESLDELMLEAIRTLHYGLGLTINKEKEKEKEKLKNR